MKYTNLRNQAGTSLIEIGVTIVIMAIGLLGLAGLQGNSLRFLKTASQRSEAVQAAYDISDRMRANAAGLNSYIYTTSYSSTVSAVPSAPPCPLTCSAATIANIDIAIWLQNLASRLNGGAGYIVANAVGGYDVTVMWQEAGYVDVDPACPAGNPPAPGAGVRCFTVRFTP
ncbi:MAG: type IV pilus modification protein PilV [Burkholderiaceae bacterium]|nr:type IV pilus modification protein PilV [Burkholderiaceae bacterium]